MRDKVTNDFNRVNHYVANVMIDTEDGQEMVTIQCKDVLRSLKLPHHIATAFTYLWRCQQKEDCEQDIHKAIQHLHYALEWIMDDKRNATRNVTGDKSNPTQDSTTPKTYRYIDKNIIQMEYHPSSQLSVGNFISGTQIDPSLSNMMAEVIKIDTTRHIVTLELKTFIKPSSTNPSHTPKTSTPVLGDDESS